MKKLSLLLSVFLLSACSTDETSSETITEETNNVTEVSSAFELESNEYTDLYQSYLSDENPVVIFEINNEDTLAFQLFPDVAPNTVANFVDLAESGFYNDIIFHRVIADFVVQGGDPEGTGAGGSEHNIPGEFYLNSFENYLSHTKGVISMARAQDLNSASSQFFVATADASFLDGAYAAFGGLVSGFDLLDYMGTVETDASDRPIDTLTITDTKVILNGYEKPTVTYVNNSYELPTVFQNDTNPVVEIEFENYGVVTLELFPEVAPETVENFLTLVNDDFYSDIIMHRIISGFMIQGGDPLGTGTGGADTNVTGEFRANAIDNPLSHVRGVISMARAQDYNSGSSQFFIVHADATFLDGNYAAFGYVTDGMDLVDAIASTEVDASDKPLEDVVIIRVEQIS